MPLPRFDRLPAATRDEILAVARTHFARDGRDGASYNQIIADVGISKTSAYHYFDGKQDLFDAVATDCAARARAALGPWHPTDDVPSFWEQLRGSSAHLIAYMAEHVDDQAILDMAQREQGPSEWTWAMLDNAIDRGLVAEHERAVMGVATQGVLDALDTEALRNPDQAESLAAAIPDLLRRLWTVPDVQT